MPDTRTDPAEDLLTSTFAAHEHLAQPGTALDLMARARAEDRPRLRGLAPLRRIPATLIGVAAAGALVAGAVSLGGLVGRDQATPAAYSGVAAASATHPVRLSDAGAAAVWSRATAAVERAGTMTVQMTPTTGATLTAEVDLRNPSAPLFRETLSDSPIPTLLSVGNRAWRGIRGLSEKPTRTVSTYAPLDRASMMQYLGAVGRRHAVAWDLGGASVKGIKAHHYRFVADRDQGQRLAPTPNPKDGRDVSDVWIDEGSGRLVALEYSLDSHRMTSSRITYGSPVSNAGLPRGLTVIGSGTSPSTHSLFIDEG